MGIFDVTAKKKEIVKTSRNFVPDKLIDKVKEIPIKDILIKYDTEIVSDRQAHCPFPGHDDERPSFSFTNSSNLFHCFGCGIGGDNISFIREYLHIDFEEAARVLCEDFDIEFVEDLERKKERELERECLNFTKEFSKATMGKKNKGTDYLNERGIGKEEAERYFLFYSENVTEAKKTARLKAKRIRKDLETERKSLYGNRLCLPIINRHGVPVGIHSRKPDLKSKVISRTTNKWKWKEEGLFGEHLIRRNKGDKVLIFEGAFDAMTASQKLYPEYVCLAAMGKIKKETVEGLAKAKMKKIYIVPDSDQAGMDILSDWIKDGGWHSDMEVYFVLLDKPLTDPDEYIKEEGIDDFLKCVEKAKRPLECYLDQFIKEDSMESPTAIIKILRTVFTDLKKMNVLERDTVVNYLCDRFKFDPWSVKDLVSKEFKEKKETPLDVLSAEEERAAFSRMMKDKDFLNWGIHVIDGSLFSLPTHRYLWKAIRETFETDTFSVEGIKTWLAKNKGEYEEGFMIGEAESIFFQDAAPAYVKDFKDRVSRLCFMKVLEEAGRKSGDMFVDMAEVISYVSREYGHIIATNEEDIITAYDGCVEFIDDLEERIATPGKLAGLDFGSNFKRLTQATGGLREKIVLTLASSQGQGKSALAASLALGLSFEKKVPGLFISFEMTRKQIVTRNISMLAEVPIEAIDSGSLTGEERDRISDIIDNYSSCPLSILDANGWGVGEIISKVRTAYYDLGLKYIVVDYIQEIAIPFTKQRHYNIGDAASMMRHVFCGELGMAIIMVAQMNKESAKKLDPGPEDVADCYGLARLTGQFVTVKPARQEVMDKLGLNCGNGYMKLKKNRFGQEEITIPLSHNTATKLTKEAERFDD